VRPLGSRMEFEAKFVGVLEFITYGPLHIGGERVGNELRLLRLHDGRLLIPASTWKGAFRSLARKLALSLPLSSVERLAVERVSDPASKLENVKDLLEDFKKALRGVPNSLFEPGDVLEVLREIGYDEELKEPEDPAGMLVSYLEYYCPVGRLFGNGVHSASTRFSDTLLEVATARRPGIGIERRTGKVRNDVLFFVESIPPGTVVKLVMVGEVRRKGDNASMLLASLLKAVDALGISIGGRRSAGYGQLNLRGCHFYVVEFRKDRDKFGELLANPFRSDRLDLNSFTSWLRGGD